MLLFSAITGDNNFWTRSSCVEPPPTHCDDVRFTANDISVVVNAMTNCQPQTDIPVICQLSRDCLM